MRLYARHIHCVVLRIMALLQLLPRRSTCSPKATGLAVLLDESMGLLH